ncbi:hypothetical protein BGX29_011136 [Mortierella sp. GBA35]|nr:hypothetical protein BGX29_011136 [Mortierella sp. GBA35]
MSANKLSLQNALLTLEQLQQTPSREDGITEEQEDHLRQLGCHLIQNAGILLKLPQVAMATAQILFQRFFYLASLRKFAVRTFYDLKNATVIAEMQILKKLGFNVHVQLPYAIMINYLKVLELIEHPVIPQRAWNFLNDGLRTSIYICYQPPTIACSVVWLAARESNVALPTSPAWWEVLDSKLEDIVNISGHIMSLYHKTLPIPTLPLSIDQVEPYLQGELRTTAAAPTASKGSRVSRFS